MLYATLETLKSNPLIGHGSSELPKTHRLHPVGLHEIVYRIQGNVVGVLRILHKRMRPPKHL